jgi:L-malate glycosyltransferase
MRVAIIIPRIEELGPVKSIQALVNSLCKSEKIEIKVFYIDKNVDPNVKILVPVERLDPLNFRFGDYDIIHTNGIRPDLFAFLNRRKIRYHISTIRNFVFDDLKFTYNKPISWIFGNIWLILWRRADKLVCVSGSLKDYYARWFPSQKLELIYNGIGETDQTPTVDNDIVQIINGFRKRGLKVIGTACVLTKRKGIDQILKVLIKEKDYSIVIIGNGKELLDLQRLAKELKVEDRCLFCGFLTSASNYFRYFDCFVMSSRSEGFGRALIEAVQEKIPVICSDIKVFQELFNANEVTFFRTDDINSLSQALKQSAITGNEKVELAYARYLEQYTDKQMAKHYYDLYKSA